MVAKGGGKDRIGASEKLSASLFVYQHLEATSDMRGEGKYINVFFFL